MFPLVIAAGLALVIGAIAVQDVIVRRSGGDSVTGAFTRWRYRREFRRVESITRCGGPKTARERATMERFFAKWSSKPEVT